MRYLALLLVLGACASNQEIWRNDSYAGQLDTGQYLYDRDDYVCRHASLQPYLGAWGRYLDAGVRVDDDMRMACMKFHGWRRIK